MSVRTSTMLFVMASLCAGPLLAQATKPEEMALGFGQAQQANAQATKQYMWQKRTQVAVGGEVKWIDLDQIRYDVDGNLQTTELSHQSKSRSKRGLRGRRQKKGLEKVEKAVQALEKTVQAYTSMSAGQLVDFFQKATFVPTTAYESTTLIQGASVLHPGDSVTLWIDTGNYGPHKLIVKTTLEGEPVSAEVDYRYVTDGPSYLAQVQASMPSKKLAVTIESYDYTRSE